MMTNGTSCYQKVADIRARCQKYKPNQSHKSEQW